MSEPITEAELQRLEQLAANATPGPWELDAMGVYFFAPDGSPVFDMDELGRTVALRLRGHGAEASGQRPEGSQLANARFVEAARVALPRLAAELREANRCIAAGRGAQAELARKLADTREHNAQMLVMWVAGIEAGLMSVVREAARDLVARIRRGETP